MCQTKNRKPNRSSGGVKYPLLKKWWFWVIVVVAVAAVAFTDTPEDKPESEPVANIATEQSKETKKTEESEQPTQEPTEPPKETDLDIITRNGHPTYYGEMQQAHSFWKDIEKGKIIFSDNFQDEYTDDTILSVGKNSKDSDIRNIEIYFENMQDATDITLDKAVSVVGEYLPYDILEEWYKFSKSYSLIPEKQSKKDNIYYIASYSLEKEQHSAPYYGSVDIIIAINENGQANYATIGFGLPRSMISAEKNGYTYAEWEHDFVKK